MSQATVKRLIFDSAILGYLLTLILLAITGPSEEELLRMDRNLWVVLAFMVVGAVISQVLNARGIRTLGESIFEPPHRKAGRVDMHWYQTFAGWELFVVFWVTVYMAARVTHFDFYELTDSEGLEGAIRLFQGIAAPNFTLLPKAIMAIIETIYIAFLATVIAVPLAFVLSFLSAKNVMGTSSGGFVLYTLLRLVLNVTRSVEPLIWAIIFSVWVGIGPFAGMLALMIQSVASLTKQYSEIVECVNEGPIEGIEATGAGRLQVIWFAIVPQIILPYVSFTIYRWDINVRMATIIGMVGGGGIGTMLMQYQWRSMWPEVGAIIVVIAIVVWLMDTASAYLREAIR